MLFLEFLISPSGSYFTIMELNTLDIIVTLIFIIKSFGCKTDFKCTISKNNTSTVCFAAIPPESLPDPDSPSSSSSESFSSSLSISFILKAFVKSVFDKESFGGFLNLIWCVPKHTIQGSTDQDRTIFCKLHAGKVLKRAVRGSLTVIVSINHLRISFKRLINFSVHLCIGILT